MGKKVLGQYAEKDARLSDVISSFMRLIGINYKNMSKKMGRSFSTHYNRMKNLESMTIGEFRTYINVLKLPEEEVLDALYLRRENK